LIQAFANLANRNKCAPVQSAGSNRCNCPVTNIKFKFGCCQQTLIKNGWLIIKLLRCLFTKLGRALGQHIILLAP